MSEWEFSPEAKGDLQEIWVYIAQDNPDAADKLEADIYDACDRLAKNPRLGHKRRDLTDGPVLFLSVRQYYMVIYLPESKPLKIVRILHGARDVSSEI
jgi:antitoxin ParD1/3/4/toxin ParE1/3/4